MALHNKIEYPIEQIRGWIAGGKTQGWIAAQLQKTEPRVTAKLIYKVCKKHGIRCQRTGPRSGPGHPDWKGGRTVTKGGYVKIYCPDHPSCVEKNARRAAKAKGRYYPKEKYVLEHRLVMEKAMGRLLHLGEVVHHKRAKHDNQPHLLVPFVSNAHHLKRELAGKCPKWTEAGKERIRLGVLKACASNRLRKGRDALKPRQKQRRSKA